MIISIAIQSTNLETMLQLPLNPFSRKLEPPFQLPSLNSIWNKLQLQDVPDGLKVESVHDKSFAGATWFNSVPSGINASRRSSSSSLVFHHIDENSCDVSNQTKVVTKPKLAAKNETVHYIFEETGYVNKIRIVPESPICDVQSEVDRLSQSLQSEISLNRPSTISQYPHEVITKWNKALRRTQKHFVCTYDNWGKEFTKSWNLVYHARIHTREKPFKCTYCRESFAQKGNLKRHLKIHSETALWRRKKFQCSICLKKYTTKFNLKVHLQTKHAKGVEGH